MASGQIVVSFCILDTTRQPYNPRPTEPDIQDAKLLYHWPTGWEVDQKRAFGGLIEGTIALAHAFTKRTGESVRDEPVTVTTRKYNIIALEVEPDVWMSFTVRRRLPTVAATTPVESPSSGGTSVPAPVWKAPHSMSYLGQQKRPERRSLSSSADLIGAQGSDAGLLDSMEDSTNDVFGSITSWKSALRNMYSTLRLLHGKIREFSPAGSIAYPEDVQLLSSKDTAPSWSGNQATNYDEERSSSVAAIQQLNDLLDDFVSPYIRSIEATAGSRLPFVSCFRGFQFSPLLRDTMLQIQAFSGVMHKVFPNLIRHVNMAYRGHLLHHTTPREDMLAIYDYLFHFNGVIDHFKLCHSAIRRAATAACRPGGGSSSYGRCNLSSSDVERYNSSDSSSVTSSYDASANKALDFFLLGLSAEQTTNSTENPSNYESLSNAMLSSRSLFTPRIHLSDGTTALLVVYQYYGISLILVLDIECPESDDPAVHARLRQEAVGARGEGRLQDLLYPIAGLYDSVTSQEDSQCFMYFNATNKAVRVSSLPLRRSTDSPPGPQQAGGLPSSTAAAASGVLSTAEAFRSRLTSIGSAIARPPDFGSVVWGCGVKVLGWGEAILADQIMTLRGSGASSWRDKTLALPYNRCDPMRSFKSIFIKGRSTAWVCSTRGLDREFFLFLPLYQHSLGEARREELSFRSTHFSHIVF